MSNGHGGIQVLATAQPLLQPDNQCHHNQGHDIDDQRA
jgi:hypothetical protein